MATMDTSFRFSNWGFNPALWETQHTVNTYVNSLSNEEFCDYLRKCLYDKKENELKWISPDRFLEADAFGQTMLHWAAVKGDPKVVEFIIKETGTQLLFSKTLEDQYSPLHLAIYGGNTEVINLLINATNEVEFIESEPQSETANEIDIQKSVQNKYVKVIDIHGQTALHIAASRGDLKICEILYDKMDVKTVAHQTNGREQTALHFAVQGCHIETVKLLLNDQAKANTLLKTNDCYGQSALHWAVGDPNKRREEIADALIESILKMTPDEQKEVVCAQKTEGYTALHLAVHTGNDYLATKLIDAFGYLPGIVDDYGQTALHWAAGKGNLTICQPLYQAMTPDEIAKPMKGRAQTALHFAVQGGHFDVVNLLIGNKNIRPKDDKPNSSKELIEVKDINNWTALDWAKKYLSTSSKDEIIKLLEDKLSPEG